MAPGTLLAVLVTLGCISYATVQAQDDDNDRRLTDAIGKFAQTMYREVSADTPNCIFSPYSAHTALSMAYLGARGGTAEEMKSVLQVSNLKDPHGPHGDLIKDLNTVEDADVYIANSAWYNEKYNVFDAYKNELTRTYDAYVERLVFNSANAKPEEPINSWVANKTESNIREIIEPDSLTESGTALVLVNTIYFNSNWSRQFSEADTRNGDFKREDGSTVKVDLMKKTGVFGYKESAFDNADLARIPFENYRFAFYVLLPKLTKRLGEVEKTISREYSNPDDWFKNMEETYMSVTLPKFKLTASMELAESLKKMGMPTAFSDRANFSGITDRRIYISRVVQKAVVDVREAGVTAAASTAVITVGSSGAKTIDFRVDRGFLYFIRDDDTGNILFQGKFSDPTVKEVEVK
ncbi:unnamed protein product [Lymnaea stagnalis]|uniref:Serpin domain-containing protein n=1 Tax=Lymnaea stagnalis TaxID=6523 RepID=A0AAV2IIC4_LYMST